jgi:uncharacterized membrane protein
MTEELRHVKQPISATLAGPYGHPYHPLLVTVPIGAWVTSLVFDIGSRVVGDPAFLARGSLWLIAIGAVGAVLAAITGFLDLLLIPFGTRAARTGLFHMSLVLLVTCAYVVNFIWRHRSPAPPGAVPVGPLALSVVSLAMLAVAGYLGGKLAFRYGVRVADETAQADGYRGTDLAAVPVPAQPQAPQSQSVPPRGPIPPAARS